jgi:SAM-dependent methyltransferase
MGDLVIGDALGAAMVSYFEHGDGGYVLERDDGWIEAHDAAVYFRPPEKWPAGEDRVLELVEGRVLDVGAGAGRYAIALQTADHEVTALDVSPGAVDVCSRRGIGSTFVGTIHDLGDESGFDTFVLGGHNLSLLESPQHALGFLDQLKRLARPGARIVGTCRSPHTIRDEDNLRYQDLNRSRGREPGQMRFRVRRGFLSTNWFEYWLMSPEELEEAVSPTAWALDKHEALAFGSYVSVLTLRD